MLNGGKPVLLIDGAQGEGGGQVLRTSLTLAMCTGRELRIRNIRARRAKPGLLRQHLTCLQAAAAISRGHTTGAELGSSAVTFRPGPVQPGQYRFAIGSAGSTSLVLQTVLLPLALAGGVSELLLEGGTHNGNAPSVDFMVESFLPVLAALGCSVDVSLERHGFYPAGGGAWRVRIQPLQRWQPLALIARPPLVRREAVAISANIPSHVTSRELAYVQKKCAWHNGELQQRLVSARGQGNLVSLRLHFAGVSALFEVAGERGVSAERVAGRAVRAMQVYLRSTAAVDEYLADQLILPLALGAGGEFTTTAPSQHLLTNIAVVADVLGVDIALTQVAESLWRVKVEAWQKHSG